MMNLKLGFLVKVVGFARVRCAMVRTLFVSL